MNILFVFAMMKELIFLLNKFDHVNEEKIGKYKLYNMKYKDINIYILHSKIGLVNTAISLTKVLNKIKPDYIINAGTAGAHDYNVNVGEIVLGKEVININEIETSFKEINEGSNSLDWKLTTFCEDEDKDFNCDLKIYSGDNNLIQKFKNIGKEDNTKLIEGRVGSGDIWNKEKDRIKYFNQNYSTQCEDMEAYSIYKIASQENIPCLGLKIISNNEMNDQKYDPSVSEKLDEFLYKFIKDLVK